MTPAAVECLPVWFSGSSGRRADKVYESRTGKRDHGLGVVLHHLTMNLLQGKVGIVTGAGTAHGIGRSAVLAVCCSLLKANRGFWAEADMVRIWLFSDGACWCTDYLCV